MNYSQTHLVFLAVSVSGRRQIRTTEAYKEATGIKMLTSDRVYAIRTPGTETIKNLVRAVVDFNDVSLEGDVAADVDNNKLGYKIGECWSYWLHETQHVPKVKFNVESRIGDWPTIIEGRRVINVYVRKTDECVKYQEEHKKKNPFEKSDAKSKKRAAAGNDSEKASGKQAKKKKPASAKKPTKKEPTESETPDKEGEEGSEDLADYSL